MRPRAFSLVELLVVIAIMAVLMAVLLPTLGRSRAVARRTTCLSQVRALQIAHWMYMEANDGRLAEINDSGNPAASWVTTLGAYYGKPLVRRCPTDDSPYWPEGGPLPGTLTMHRGTSYGINNYLSSLNVNARYTRLSRVPRPFATIHFVHMATLGNSAGADHVHPDDWWVAANPAASPALAAAEMATAAHGGPARAWTAVSAYGYLDGHAETAPFRDVFTNLTQNNFNPAVAR
jgi:prepilin-type N-terminal cleavage/methylation domain-containing protein